MAVHCQSFLKAGMHLKLGSKSWLAPHVDQLLGDVAVLHSPFFGSGKLWRCVVSTPSSPSQTCAAVT